MSQIDGLTEAGLKTPKAAAVAGVVFSLLTLASFGLLWSAIPADQQASGAWLVANGNEIALALNLIPFAGIAFLWFIGVIRRDQLGQREDRFFATVFLGSGLLFLGMLFVAAAVVGAMLAAFGDEPAAFGASPAFRLARAVSSNLVNIYMVKMAGVFMISTSTVAMATRFAPRWLAGLGYLLAALLLVGSSFLRWSFVLFPLWVLLLSIHFLAGNADRRSSGA